ncbi:MAG: acetaldehyde dehydrogenase (acetylating) [Clostridia bacterium]|nr:acetaldehyde dehydrogenase (acetylating) [Clostridia bacterium]
MGKKLRAAILGTGMIATDLLIKLQRCELIECSIFIGRREDSEGIKIAKSLGVATSAKGIEAIVENPDICDIVFDATSAGAHLTHAPILEKLGKLTLDLTPSKIGKMCVPTINLDECLCCSNINFITCAGQASIPLAHAISKIHPNIEYFEIVTANPAQAVGMGSRKNVDEYVHTTGDAAELFTGATKCKILPTLNSTEPPMTMRNTVYALIENPDLKEISKAVAETEREIKKYAPGYRVVFGPAYAKGCVVVAVEVEGAGDYLPKYSGNLDIINCAAIKTAEGYAKKVL